MAPSSLAGHMMAPLWSLEGHRWLCGQPVPGSSWDLEQARECGLRLHDVAHDSTTVRRDDQSGTVLKNIHEGVRKTQDEELTQMEMRTLHQKSPRTW